MKRSEIDSKYKWNLGDIYATNEVWEADFGKLQGIMPTLADLKEGLTKSAGDLANALKKLDEASLLCERLFVYARMKRDEDNANSLYQGMTDRAMSLYVAVSGEASFVAPTLLKEEAQTLEDFIKEEPRLLEYAFMIRDLIRKKKHVLGESEEKLLSMSADFASGAKDIFTMLNNVDMKFGTIKKDGEDVQLTHAKYIELMQDKDRAVRKDTYDTFYKTFKENINTIAATYSTSVKKDVYYAKVRGYDSALAKALFGDNVPTALYDKLISCVHDSLPIMHEYVDTRKKILGLSEIAMYDVYTPLVSDTSDKYSYESAIDMCIEALAPMGDEYLMLLNRAKNEGWIDVFESEGKTSGAYSWGPYGTHPYVLLNHREDLNSVYTVAHELGHALHSYYSEQNQPYPTAGYTIFVAEVASTVNEILLTMHLLDNTKGDLKKYVLNHYLDQFRTTVLRQTMFAEFEKETHEMCESGQPLTQQTLSQKFGELNRLYYGDVMQTDETIMLEWARIPHFYNAFYVYKYATGFSAAVMIATGIYQGKPGVLDAYKEFLKSGGSDYPLELLKKAGVDFIDGDPVGNCMAVFSEVLKEFKKVMSV
jgi:oligoendopeptidase F